MDNSESIVVILTRRSRFTCYKCTLSLIYETTCMHIFVYVFIQSVDLEVCKVTV